jgi:hypothetical protein
MRPAVTRLFIVVTMAMGCCGCKHVVSVAVGGLLDITGKTIHESLCECHKGDTRELCRNAGCIPEPRQVHDRN